MSSWREPIVRRFVPGVARVTAVSDPDGLLRDPDIGRAIEAKGFAILQFEDSVAFRYDYESLFRCRWDNGEPAELVVVFQPGENEFATLPADVLVNSHRLSFGLKEVFPKLSYEVIAQLEMIYYDELYEAHQRFGSQVHDAPQTRGFILRHVFGIEPSVIKIVPDLLKMLCQRHYAKLSIPPQLDRYLIQCLQQNPQFNLWPLETIVPNRAAFWEFLDERWPVYVRQAQGDGETLSEQSVRLKYPGPLVLPFRHDNIRVYIDNFFEDGLLTPVTGSDEAAKEQPWIRVGLIGNRRENIDLRFEELGRNLDKECPAKGGKPYEWLAYAYRYAQENLLWTQLSGAGRMKYQAQYPILRESVNRQFQEWLTAHYSGLFNYPASSPLMVHHIPGFMAHQLANGLSRRSAFVLVDGLAIDQWLIIKDVLKAQGLPTLIEENALFAWVPTITPVSRQAAFAGKIPRYLADTVDRTDHDESRWRQFWADRGLGTPEIGFAAVTGDRSDLAAIAEKITPQTKAMGITIFKVDKIMHGIQMGSVGMAGQVRTWAEDGFFHDLLNTLHCNVFDVIISADHGNTEARGMGRPKEGVLSDKGGDRCRIYSDPVLQQSCRARFPETIVWEHTGLPDRMNTLIAPYGKAFTDSQTQLVCHGGIALEEVVVPFIRVGGGR